MEFIKRSGYSDIEKDDVATLRAFEALQKEWIFDICLLSSFEWYNNYFKKIINNIGLYSIVAHNGILCGDASFFYDNSESKNLATIILFKDKNRPYLDVARDGVRGLTLETASEIEIIRYGLVQQGFKIHATFSELREANYPFITMNDYCKLLCRRSDLTKQLVFRTSEGYLSNENLTNTLLQKEKIIYNSCPNISYILSWEKNRNLYEYLCAAFLRENYLLQVQFASYNSEVFISKQKKEISDDYKNLFPACFFLPEINNNCDILTTESNYERHACNEYHRLSQYILKNGIELKRYVPGIFRELLRILAQEERDELIDGINSLLESLRKFPGGLFEVSDELFLSEKDLI